MAGITLERALKEFGRQIGVQEGRECLIDDITTQLEFCLLNGGGEILQEWHLPIQKGTFTFPYDLEAPVKFRLSDRAGVGLGMFNSPFYSYSSGSLQNCCGFNTWDNYSCEVLANRTPTQHQPPECGGYIMATTTNPKDVGKQIEVGGSYNGFPLPTTYNGYKTAGMVLTIYHQEDPYKRYGNYLVDRVTSVTKELTCDYVTLSGIEVRTGNPFFLSHYHPDETTPMYQQGCWRNCPSCNNCDLTLHLLGRINPSIRYIRDEQILPVTSYEMLSLLAKRCRYDKAADFDKVAVQEARLAALIRRQVFYQQKTSQDISFNLKGTGATLANV